MCGIHPRFDSKNRKPMTIRITGPTMDRERTTSPSGLHSGPRGRQPCSDRPRTQHRGGNFGVMEALVHAQSYTGRGSPVCDSLRLHQARMQLRADIANADSVCADDPPRQQSSEAFVPRLQIDMTALDLRIQERIAKYGSIKDFHVLLWRDEPDATGCNWNARIDRVRGGSSDSSWWRVVP